MSNYKYDYDNELSIADIALKLKQQSDLTSYHLKRANILEAKLKRAHESKQKAKKKYEERIKKVIENGKKRIRSAAVSRCEYRRQRKIMQKQFTKLRQAALAANKELKKITDLFTFHETIRITKTEILSRTVIRYKELSQQGIITDTELFVMMTGYQMKFFTFEQIKKVCGDLDSRLKYNFKKLIDAGYVSRATNRGMYWYITKMGIERYEAILQYFFEGNSRIKKELFSRLNNYNDKD